MLPVSIEIVHAWGTKMTGFVRIGFRIFNRPLTDDRHWQHSNSVRFKDSANFLDCFPVLTNVLQDVGGKDKIISRICKRQVSNVYAVIYPFRKQIGSLVAAKSLREHRAEELLRREVEHLDSTV